MWKRNGRRFWFYDRYFCFGHPGQDSANNAAESLNAALRQCEAGVTRIMYYGNVGWFNAVLSEWQPTPAEP